MERRGQICKSGLSKTGQKYSKCKMHPTKCPKTANIVAHKPKRTEVECTSPESNLFLLYARDGHKLYTILLPASCVNSL